MVTKKAPKAKPERRHPSIKGSGPGGTVTEREALARNQAIDAAKAGITKEDVAAAKAAVKQMLTPTAHKTAPRASVKPFLSAVTVLECKALRAQRQALEAQLAALAADLVAREMAIIAALDAGLVPGPGCPLVAVKEEPAPIRPKWKDEALGLADKLGLDPGVYEAEVKARVKAELPPEKRVVKKLIINGEK